MKTADFTLPRSVIKRQRSQIRSEYKWLSVTSDSTTSASDYEWPRVTTSDYNWLRARLRVTAIDYKVTTSEYEWLWVTTVDYKPLKVATSDYEPRYKWLQVTTNDCKQLPVKLRMTTTEIGNNLRHKNVYCLLWLHNNERRNTLKSVLKIVTVLVKIIEKYLRCRSSCSQMFFKVTVLKNAFNLQFYSKETPTQGFSYEICEILEHLFLQKTSGGCFWRWELHI